MVLYQPDLRPRNSKEFVLNEDFTYRWLEGKDCRITIFAGFITDIASVPAWAALLGYKADGLHRAAALVHDILYNYQGMIPAKDLNCCYEELNHITGEWEAVNRVFTREDCDWIFYQAMLKAGVSEHRAWVMWKSVRIFGRFAW